jgi:hypothetical protein
VSAARTCPACGYHREYATEARADAHHRRHSCPRQRARAESAFRRAERAATGPQRDCTHPGHPHQHGQRVTYVKDRCRCPACTAANTLAGHNTARQQTFGRWNPYVDATAAREHIRLLRAHHLGYAQIARLAGTSFTHIREIAGTVARSGNRPPITHIRQDLAIRILAVTPDPANRAPQSQIDATGTRRRLQALVAVGWPTHILAARIGRTPSNLRRTMISDTVTTRTALIVSDLYNELWDIEPPHTTQDDRDASAAARRTAKDQGWAPPLAWDDIDTDPHPNTAPATPDPGDLDEIAIERAIAGDSIRLLDLTPAEQAEVVDRLTKSGKSIRDIATQLATTTRTVSRRRESAANAA